ncbi:hypothetical protein BD309DRAFT_878033 [Dichomitus squalens]|uniref:Uncharacterized protein n=2 Tax=Dichomitus squalens TaxID=114155 RepID=A0A4V2K2G8_9APHY|nr:uncharacterized protein DICSQDRAFT_174883 [Dichomitus squalens LYAD-421 SS1]EJF56432.1 hypothetical protein DICSQDRAFT_174883 [Dichomitus squalens LYAD-421 SS1]TBU21187.1 hypothetical protein BD311DRAFT_679115 [Dichomitus squalens]TBU36623.1 hypothetical protein BD309DRAFT_878033 [Dichomitus squalens]TBU53041.1 hypothetical protein BD310DRAFT_952339 [Dichomitus squalens]
MPGAFPVTPAAADEQTSSIDLATIPDGSPGHAFQDAPLGADTLKNHSTDISGEHGVVDAPSTQAVLDEASTATAAEPRQWAAQNFDELILTMHTLSMEVRTFTASFADLITPGEHVDEASVATMEPGEGEHSAVDGFGTNADGECPYDHQPLHPFL